jgi:hypothetical protein
MTLELTDDEAALLLKELNDIIDGDRYSLSDPPPNPGKRSAPRSGPSRRASLYHRRRSATHRRGRVRRVDEAEGADVGGERNRLDGRRE